LITGLVSFVAVAPSIVRAQSIMPVKVMKPLLPVIEVKFKILKWVQLPVFDDRLGFAYLMTMLDDHAERIRNGTDDRWRIPTDDDFCSDRGAAFHIYAWNTVDDVGAFGP